MGVRVSSFPTQTLHDYYRHNTQVPHLKICQYNITGRLALRQRIREVPGLMVL
jgi:hypothetical protein